MELEKEKVVIVFRSSGSTNLISPNTSPVDRCNLQYFVDWDSFPTLDKYNFFKVSFTFRSISSGTTNNLDIGRVYFDFGVPTQTYENGQSQSTLLGVLYPALLGTNNYLFNVDETENPDIILKGRPTNQTPIVRIRNISNETTITNLGQYILVMTIQPL